MPKSGKVEIWGVNPPPLGGISVYCKRLTEQLAGLGCNVTLVNFARSRSADRHVRNVKCIFCEFLRLLFVSRRTIHVQLRNVWFLTALYLFGFRHNLVITIHNRKMLLLGGWKKKAMKLFLKRTSKVIFNDETFMPVLVEQYGVNPQKCMVLPTFIPPSNSERRGVPQEIIDFCKLHEKTISTNASIIVRNAWGDVYGLEQLISMMDNLVNKRGMDVGLLFLLSEIGDNKYYTECLERIEKLGLKDNILFLIGLDTNGFEVWEKTNLFVRATLTDMEGISVKEALMTGTTVVASNVCTRPLPTILYSCGNVEDLTEKCAQALAYPKPFVYEPETNVPASIMEVYRAIGE